MVLFQTATINYTNVLLPRRHGAVLGRRREYILGGVHIDGVDPARVRGDL